MMWYTVVLDVIKKFWPEFVIGGLVVGLLFTNHQWHHNAQLYQDEKVAHAQDLKNFKIIQEVANSAAEAQRTQLLKEAKANADQADTNYAALLGQYHASILRYQANQRGTEQATDSEHPPAQSGNGPSSSTDLPFTITISGSDAQICAVNTARLQAVHDWAVSLPK